jgi:hypothetical protein
MTSTIDRIAGRPFSFAGSCSAERSPPAAQARRKAGGEIPSTAEFELFYLTKIYLAPDVRSAFIRADPQGDGSRDVGLLLVTARPRMPSVEI